MTTSAMSGYLFIYLFIYLFNFIELKLLSLRLLYYVVLAVITQNFFYVTRVNTTKFPVTIQFFFSEIDRCRFVQRSR